MGKSRRKTSRDAPPSAQTRLVEARKLKQQAERKGPGDPSREALLVQSVASFEASLLEQLSTADYEECLFDLAETFFLLAGTAVKYTTYFASPFRGNLTKAKFLEMQVQAFTRAANLYRQSSEIYEKVRSFNEFKQEATVNCANALCEWAEVLIELPEDKGGGLQVACKLYCDAQTRYMEAAIASPDDIEVLTNFGDCQTRQAELSLQNSRSWELVKPIFDEAQQAYAKACALADTRKGDDLCGLLQNWAAGLLSMAKNIPDAAESVQLFACAREKLQTAIKFNPTDSSIFNALGELSIAQFEKFPRSADQVLSQALDCFKSTLKIDSNNIDALLGLAEVHFLVSKSLNSQEQAALSADFYLKSTELLSRDTDRCYDLNFIQHCEVLYNLACAAALCCRESVACLALQQLVQAKGVTADELLGDPDLQSLKTKEWYSKLISGAS